MTQSLGNTAIEHTKLRKPQNLWAILFGTIPHSLIAEQRRRFLFRTTDLLTRKHGIEICFIKNQQDATLAVLFISNCKITLHVSDAFCFHNQEY